MKDLEPLLLNIRIIIPKHYLPILHMAYEIFIMMIQNVGAVLLKFKIIICKHIKFRLKFHI